jgi:tRNA 2-thiocytidine biosynthesis protein TtcA
MVKLADPHKQAFWLFKNINKAIREFDMLQAGDRIGVAVSGGKDSLSLLRLLDWRRKTVPVRYELVAVHIIGDARGPECPAHPPLQAWIQNSGYEYAIEPLILPADEVLPMNCQRCAWNRRRTLFQVFRRLRCNVIAFGHHADDLAQTTLLNLFYSGRVETMTPIREYFDGDLRLIRPLCYTAEKDLRRFARANQDFPDPPPKCPQSDHSKREMARDFIWQAEKKGHQVRTNLMRAGLRGNQLAEKQNGDEK